MRLPTVHGIIRRRILVNYRVAPEIIQRQLPSPFRPKLHDGMAIAGICLIRLEQIRPHALPAFLGLSSENAAHRIAVQWDDAKGHAREGVFISRRDTSSTWIHLVGGRIFPGEHHLADFTVQQTADRIELEMTSRDKKVHVVLRAAAAASLPSDSCFENLAAASAFFEPGALGYSVTRDPNRLDGIRLATRSWRMEPLTIEHHHSSYFADTTKFPPGSVTFDCALLMRDIQHEWFHSPDFHLR